MKEQSSDASIRAEVERLLAEHDEAGTFLSRPPVGSLALKAEALSRKFSEGTLLAGRFRIVQFIAAGGMGGVGGQAWIEKLLPSPRSNWFSLRTPMAADTVCSPAFRHNTIFTSR